MATPLHSQNFVMVNEGILTNNRRLVTRNMWFNGTALSAQARKAASAGPFLLDADFAARAGLEAGLLPELRMAISTASALGADVAAAFEKRFQLPVTQALGIIEVGLPLLNRARAHDLPTALGQPLPAYQAMAAPDGELLLKGPGMFDAYLSPWQTRAEILRDGWFATGDLVEIHEDGTVIMHGRSKSVINVGGMKVFPEEIENALNDHPAVALSRAFAGEHATLGSFPCAEVIVNEGHRLPTPAGIREHCKERLSPHKIPMRVDEVKTIALTASGKVKRV
jgi:acyl-coenzyme A synthetase/AMP-(fatty) acid ligase